MKQLQVALHSILFFCHMCKRAIFQPLKSLHKKRPKATSYGRFLKIENEGFRTAKPIINLYGPENGTSKYFHGSIILGIVFGMASTRKWRSIFGYACVRKWPSGVRIVTGFDRSWKATIVVISRKQQYKPHPSPKQQVH